MTTASLAAGNRAIDNVVRPRRSLEELVDQLMAALKFGDDDGTAERSAPRTIHEARRLRQAGDVDGALAALAEVDTARTDTNQARWAFSEWQQLVKRRFGDRSPMVYSQGTGRATALVPSGDGTLEVVAVLGMRWRPGKVVSGRSLRGLRPLAACPRHPLGDTVEAAGVRLTGRGRVRQGSAPSMTRTVRQTGRFSAPLGPWASASPPMLERAARSTR